MHTRTHTQLPTYTHTHPQTHKRACAHSNIQRTQTHTCKNLITHGGPHIHTCTHTYTHAHTQEHTRIHRYTNFDTHRHTHEHLHTHMHAHTHTLSCTPINHETSQIFTNTLMRLSVCVRASAHTHHAPGYAVGATAVHTLFSSEAYAHTIILLC